MCARAISNSQGFTIIELLTTMTILGVLAATAVDQFNGYQRRAFDARAIADLQSAVSFEEAYFGDHESYLSCSSTDCSSTLGGFVLSPDIDLVIEASDDGNYFTATASHPRGRINYSYDSTVGTITKSNF